MPLQHFEEQYQKRNNPIYKRIDKQIEKGLEKYGQPVSSNSLSMLEWFEHKQEELTDALVYNQCLIENVKEAIKHLEYALDMREDQQAGEIQKALDILKGER